MYGTAVKAIEEDKDGNIWIGTNGKGLSRYNKKTKDFNHYVFNRADSTSLSTDYIGSILSDSQGRLWIGTEGNGINLYQILLIYKQTGSFQMKKNQVLRNQKKIPNIRKKE